MSDAVFMWTTIDDRNGEPEYGLLTPNQVRKGEVQLALIPADAYRHLEGDARRYRTLRSHSYVDGDTILFGAGYRQTRPEVLDSCIDGLPSAPTVSGDA